MCCNCHLENNIFVQINRNMKKNLSIIIIAALCMAVSSFTDPLTKTGKSNDSAVIYIYRVGQFAASGANWALFADGEKLCKLSNNKFIKHEVKPGKHLFSSKVGGVGIMKKETEIEINAEAGQSYYIACNVKSSFTRSRLELIEVTKGTAEKQMVNMKVDNCQEGTD